jgi:tripartite-type tricarboxylate transporter receptor subunit TctC
MWAPAKTPRTIVARLNQEAMRTLQAPDVKERFASSGAEALGSTPEQFAQAIQADAARIAQVIKSTGIRTK